MMIDVGRLNGGDASAVAASGKGSLEGKGATNGGLFQNLLLLFGKEAAPVDPLASADGETQSLPGDADTEMVAAEPDGQADGAPRAGGGAQSLLSLLSRRLAARDGETQRITEREEGEPAQVSSGAKDAAATPDAPDAPAVVTIATPVDRSALAAAVAFAPAALAPTTPSPDKPTTDDVPPAPRQRAASPTAALAMAEEDAAVPAGATDSDALPAARVAFNGPTAAASTHVDTTAAATTLEAAQEPVLIPVTVVGRETHFAPLAASAPRQQRAATSATGPVSADDSTLPPEDADASSIEVSRVTDRPEAKLRGDGRKIGDAIPPTAVADAEPPTLTVLDAESNDPAPRPTRSASHTAHEPATAEVATGVAATTASNANTATPAPAVGGGLSPASLNSLTAAIATTAGDMTAVVASADTAAPVRVFTVRLDLPDQGAVHVRMALTDTSLSIRLVADDDETARRLRHDRDGLAEALRHGGYDTSITAIDSRRAEAADGPRPASQTGQGSGTASGNPGEAGSGTRQQSAGGQQRSAPQDGFPNAGVSSEGRQDETSARDPRSGSLYV